MMQKRAAAAAAAEFSIRTSSSDGSLEEETQQQHQGHDWRLRGRGLQAVESSSSGPVPQVAGIWSGTTAQDLMNEYYNIFVYGNRNAASHLWSKFLLERSAQMSH